MDRLCNYYKQINQCSSTMEKTRAPCWEWPHMCSHSNPPWQHWIDIRTQTHLPEECLADCCAFMALLLYISHSKRAGLLGERQLRGKRSFWNICKSNRYLSATCFEYLCCLKALVINGESGGRLGVKSPLRGETHSDCMWSANRLN